METTSTPDWPLTKKLLFRFFFIYFLLYIFLNPNDVLPYIGNLYKWYVQPFYWLAIKVGGFILNLAMPAEIPANGSGDTAYDYVIILIIASLALIGMITWSVLDRKRPSYNKLFYWLTVVLRYYIAITMLAYGFYKVIKLQFPFPSFARLMEPYGNSSPMGLAWTFMGYSTGYNYFTGIAELSCGILLLFRKTSALGAVMTLVVAGNIMAINYCFDVPVKLLSTTLVMMALFLIIKDVKRFSNFFVFNKSAAPANLSPHRFTKRWKNITLTVVKYTLIAYTLVFDAFGAMRVEKQYGDKAPKSPLYGLYEVKTFIVNRDTLKPLTTDMFRWNKLAIDGRGGYLLVQLMNDSTTNMGLELDTVKKKMTITNFTDAGDKYRFTYTLPQKDSLVIKGTYKKDSIQVRFHRYGTNKFLLVRRGFHWINEYPFNR
ncbi:MAG TPA: DoxX family protein [Mucilaginibacter sp.]|nr:DoxX family protein [Mucilaginibacter sp.]